MMRFTVTRKVGRILPSVLCLAVAGLLLANIGLQCQNTRLINIVEQLKYSRGPRPGALLFPLIGTSADGDSRVLDVRSTGTKALVLVFSAHCGICSENWDMWRELLHRTRVPVIFADVADSVTPLYITRHKIPLESLITHIDLNIRWKHDLRDTPETIVFDNTGRVHRVWLG
ncbi:MAG: hypothetical protein LC126_03355, partial [Bryobacterales bacterium]|nr:hypothetical protein [Bryobacterales bacterium]